MTPKDKILEVVRRAMIDAETLPVNDRADLYEGVSMLLAVDLPSESNIAWETAVALRDAEAHQLKFNLLLKEGAR